MINRISFATADLPPIPEDRNQSTSLFTNNVPVLPSSPRSIEAPSLPHQSSNNTTMYFEKHKSALPQCAKNLKFEWKDLNVFVGDGYGKQILFDSNGCVESGQLLAVMGGSGAGKSTLLNALSGRTNLNEQTVKGDLAINNRQFECSNQKIIKDLCTFVPQSDCLCATQTVEEALLFYAKLKSPHLTLEKQWKRINYLIH
eukprot:56104_1